MRVNLLLLAFTVLCSLLLHLIIQTEKHLVTVLFILDFSLLDHFGILELSQLLFSLEQCLHLVLTLLLLLVVPFDHVLLLSIEPIHAVKKAKLAGSTSIFVSKKVTFFFLESSANCSTLTFYTYRSLS